MASPANRRLPGDDVLPDARLVMDRVLHLAGTPATVWPWLEQLGKGRAGWYLPSGVERFVPRERRAARRVDDRWLGLSVGDSIPDWGPGDPTFEVLEIERPRHLVHWSQRPRRPRRGVAREPIRLTWALVLREQERESTELHLRLRVDLGHDPGPVARYGGGAMDRATIALLGRGLNERLRDAGS